MKRFLLFAMMCVCASIGAWAADFEWTSSDGQQYKVTASDVQVGNSATYQKLVVNKAGALAAFVEATKGDANNVLMGVGGNASRVNLQIEGPLNSDDFSALNSTEVERWGTFTSLDLKNATIEDMSVITSSSMNMGNLKYMRLSPNLTDVNAMESLKTLNASLDLVLSIGDLGTTLPKVYINSFTPNSVVKASDIFKNGYNGFEDLRACKYVTMTGDYGNTDLVNGTSKNFGDAAVWDFTGASFAACKVNPAVNRGPYYASNDPFCDHPTVTISSSYKSNAFFYFNYYSTMVVEITLPTGITELPPTCLNRLGEENGPNYKLVYNKTDAEYAAMEAEITETMRAMNKGYNAGAYYPIDELIVPDNIVTLGYECCVQSVVKSVQLGTGVKEVQGGAFKLNSFLENLDCKSGISECRLGDQAFNECNNMKHIVLSEGIISLGNKCFENSQHLESIRLPETLLYIGNESFKDGHALSSITIPENVEKIGKGAFSLTALTDVYLTTTDPMKVPEIWTAGTQWSDNNATFSINQLYGNNAIPYDLSQATQIGLNNMTWDEAVEYYYSHSNRIAQLHYPSELADKVLATISEGYGAHTKDGEGLPVKNEANHDQDRRATGDNGAVSMGTSDGKGIYTSDGWAQFLLMKEYVPNKPGGDVFTKEYDDVWYTMCFPFDLTDEQLAGAFNEGFNIADFSGVEIKEKTDDDPMTMILHFNTVAKTTYKDLDGNVYTVTGREPDGKYDYNVYQRDGKTYKHVQVGEGGAGYKTKTFAENGDKTKEIIMIDGILATAGHPYMIHPNTGTNTGMPLTRCHFSGITWKPADQWETIFDAEKREVDLGVPKGEMGETLKDCTPSEDNYLQAEYTEHAGEKYTFIGNWKQFRSDIEIPAELAKPTVENGKLTPTPSVTDYTDLFPHGPAMPAARQAVIDAVGVKMTTAPTVVSNPADDPAYADVKDLLVAVRLTQNNEDVYYYDDLANNGIGDFFTNYGTWAYRTQSESHGWANLNEAGLNLFKAYFDNKVFNGNYNNSPEEKFAELQGIAVEFAGKMEAYNDYLIEKAAYDANIAAWTEYETANATENEQYLTAVTTYTTAITNWRSACASVEASNNRTLAAWEESMNPYRVLIPTYSYFLGRRGRGWPKFYREIADDTRTNATGGFWTQYTAVVKPNQNALDGIEAELDGKTQQSKGSDMLFDEGFINYVDEEDEGVVTAIEKAQEAGAKVEYMDIVVSVDGQIVRRGSTSLEGLPKGLYIINGKKYFVK